MSVARKLHLAIIATLIAVLLLFAFPLHHLTWGQYLSKIAHPEHISESEHWNEFKMCTLSKTKIADQARCFIKHELWLLNLTGGIIFVGAGDMHCFVQFQQAESDATLVFVFDKSWKFIKCYSMSLA